MPAMFQAFKHGAFPHMGRILAVSREVHTQASYCQWLWQKFQTLNWDERPTLHEFEQFSQHIHFESLDLSQPEAYDILKSWVLNTTITNDAVAFYLATAPNLFSPICANLGRVGLNEPHMRVVLEKPLGKDLASAIQINSAVAQYFKEDQTYRIDHYLGKQSVQNLMALRFGNSIFEPLWRREVISNVQITIAEDLGIEQRGAYYEKAGALRDMLQNHLLQLLSIVAMEPPASSHADAIRDEKLKVLRCLRPMSESDVSSLVVRGQYCSGNMAQTPVKGYLQEDHVAPDSTTETFIAVRAEIDNWRWAGVPFFLRTGKRMAHRGADIVINFRPVPHPIFPMPVGNHNNRLVITLQPEETIEMQLLAKASNRAKAETGRLVPIQLDMDFREEFGQQTIEAYERLLRKVIAGKLDLFVRFDELQAAWTWVEPIIRAWQKNPSPPEPYDAGTWGPESANRLLEKDHVVWQEQQNV